MIKKLLRKHLIKKYNELVQDDTFKGDPYTFLCERLMVLIFIMRVTGYSEEVRELYKKEINTYYGNPDRTIQP